MADEQVVEFMLVCFDGHSTAAKRWRSIRKKLHEDGAEVLDEVVLSVSPQRKVRDYDPHRTVGGALTPALTWGVFGLLSSGGSWASLVLWALIGGIGGGIYAYFAERTVSKTSLARAGEQLPADSSAVGFFVRSGDAEADLRSVDAYKPVVTSAVGIAGDLSARVWSGAANPAAPATRPSASLESSTLVSMVLLRFKGRDSAQRMWADKTGGKVDKNAAIQTEVIVAVDADHKLHVDSPSQGIRMMVKGDIVAWGLFGVVFGLFAGWAGNGTLFGALERGVLTGIAWGIFGAGAGALYGIWAGRGVSARRLKGIEPLLQANSSLLVAWADGAVTDEALADWSTPEAERLVLRFNTVERGAVLEV